MPELPDITVYIEALEKRVQGTVLERARLINPFVLRTVDPPWACLDGATVVGFRRLGKRIVMAFKGELFLVMHLMIAGRLQWVARTATQRRRLALAAFDFPDGTLVFTEAGSKRRASLHLVRGAAALAEFNRGGLEVLGSTRDAFAERLRSENHTIKRGLADPRLFSGIGNAYSDEILHRARLSPMALTRKLDDEAVTRLYNATRSVLVEWTDRLRAATGDAFPGKVTAFRDGMAVHGRYRLPCPVCNAPVQRIRYAENETNYCARCQTGGRLLADRGLSRLLKEDWPRSIDEL